MQVNDSRVVAEAKRASESGADTRQKRLCFFLKNVVLKLENLAICLRMRD